MITRLLRRWADEELQRENTRLREQAQDMRARAIAARRALNDITARLVHHHYVSIRATPEDKR